MTRNEFPAAAAAAVSELFGDCTAEQVAPIVLPAWDAAQKVATTEEEFADMIYGAVRALVVNLRALKARALSVQA